MRHGTAWQLEARQETPRDRNLLPFVRLALAGAPDAELPEADLAEGEASLPALLRRVWRLRWDNNYKVACGGWCRTGCRCKPACPVLVRSPEAAARWSLPAVAY